MNTNQLKGKLREYGLTQEALAGEMGVSLSRLNAKVNQRGGAEFTLGELKTLKRILRLNPRQVDAIFFA